MATMEITEVQAAVPFVMDEQLQTEMYPGGMGIGYLVWNSPTGGECPPYWSPGRDIWLRTFLEMNDPLKAITNTFINKIVTVPWSIQARDKTVDRYVRRADDLQTAFRRNSGSMASSPIKGFTEAMKMFWVDYLTQDNGAFMLILGDGPADGPITGAPVGVLHLDSALCVRTKNAEYPVKYLNRGRGGDNAWYKIHYTRIIEMSNFPSANTDFNGIGHCALSCCLAPAQELWDIFRYSSEMFGSRPPRQILYAKKGATVSTLEAAIQHWNLKLDNESRTRFGGTLVAAPGKLGQELELDILNLTQMPDGFNRRDTTTIDLSLMAAAFGLDLRDIAYTLGAPSRTGDAEVQDRKGHGKGVGEAISTFQERFNEAAVNGDIFYIEFDYLDDTQDAQAAEIRNLQSQSRQRDLVGGVTTVRTERTLMWEAGDISEADFSDMELADGRLPDGLDVLLLFQSQDKDYEEWLDIGVPDPTNLVKNNPEETLQKIHAQILLVSEYIHLQTQATRRRAARQALAALEKLQLQYQDIQAQALAAEAAQQQLDMQQQAMDAKVAAKAPSASGTPVQPHSTNTPTPPAKPGQSPNGHANQQTPKLPASANSASNMRVVKEKELVEGMLAGINDLLSLTHVKDDGPQPLDPEMQISGLMGDYDQKFRGLVDSAMNGQIPRNRFEELLAQLVFATLLALYLQGANLSEGNLTKEEWSEVADYGNPHYQAIASLTDDIYGGRYTIGSDAAYTRIGGWLNTAKSFFMLGMTRRRDDPLLQWVYSVFTDHCADCVRLDGQVHRASEWRAAGWIPRDWRLECHGIHCQCSFMQVDAPVRGAF